MASSISDSELTAVCCEMTDNIKVNAFESGRIGRVPAAVGTPGTLSREHTYV
jgi:hypothetical protein